MNDKTCYMCSAEKTGLEHVPPKCLFPEKKDLPESDYRKNLISVPSCDLHNSRKSKDDEYLLFVLISHFENNQVASRQFSTKIIRALKRNQKLFGIYNRKTKDALLDGEPTMAYEVGWNRIQKELEHVARGLYFHECKEIWTHRVMIQSPAFFALEGPKAGFINQTTQDMNSMATLLFDTQKNIGKKGDNPEVFWYQLHAEPNTSRLIIKMCFYGGIEVIALSDPILKQKVEQGSGL